jgi:hypothetical protein
MVENICILFSSACMAGRILPEFQNISATIYNITFMVTQAFIGRESCFYN